MNIHIKIIQKRKEHHMTQQQLADLIGVSRQSVAQWEGGHTCPDMDRMVQLARVLNVSCDYLLDDAIISDSVKSNQPRLLLNLINKQVILSLAEDSFDWELFNQPCIIEAVDPNWIKVKLVKSTSFESKIIQVASIQSIKEMEVK